MALASSQSNSPYLAHLPHTLPKTQAEWQQFLNALQAWEGAISSPKWLTPTLKNSWVFYGGSYNPPGYYQDVSGRVHVRGLIKSGTLTDGTVLATLPYFPPYEYLTVGMAYSGSAYSPVRLDVGLSGNILIYNASTFTGSYWVSLDGLSFLTQ